MATEYIRGIRADFGMPDRVSDRVIRVLCRNPSPYTYTGTGTYLVGAGANLAVIDPGPMMLEHGEALLAIAGERKISHILVTHSHIDHSPLSAWLSEKTGAPTYAFGPHGTGRKGGLEDEDVEAGADKAFMPDTRLHDGDILTGDGWSLRAIHTPGHTANHLCFMLEEEDTLFSGDHIMGWATTVIAPPDGDMRDYLASLSRIVEEAPARLLPTHGPAVEDPVPFVRGIITHRRMREGQILKLLEEGPMTIDIMVSRMYKDVDKRLHGAAARSVFGHLIALVDEGRVGTEGPPRLQSQYQLDRAPKNP